jgi:hypothetical protein
LDGAFRLYHPGDWFQCRNQELAELLAQKAVETSGELLSQEFTIKHAGILLLKGAVPPKGLDRYGIEVSKGTSPKLLWEYTMILGPKVATTANSVALGFMRLIPEDDSTAWEMAAMLESHTRLIGDVGSIQEQHETMKIVGDLRIPLYNPGSVWVRRTSATVAVVDKWRGELEAGVNPQHAFIRAIYSQSVMLNTLPADWIGEWIRV